MWDGRSGIFKLMDVTQRSKVRVVLCSGWGEKDRPLPSANSALIIPKSNLNNGIAFVAKNFTASYYLPALDWIPYFYDPKEISFHSDVTDDEIGFSYWSRRNYQMQQNKKILRGMEPCEKKTLAEMSEKERNTQHYYWLSLESLNTVLIIFGDFLTSSDVRKS